MIGYKEGLRILGRVVLKDGINYTVTTVNHPNGAIAVWNTSTSELIFFDSVETFENWAYGTPVLCGSALSPNSNPAAGAALGEVAPVSPPLNVSVEILELLKDCLGSLQMESECDGCTVDLCTQCRIKTVILRAKSGEEESGPHFCDMCGGDLRCIHKRNSIDIT